MPWVWDRIETMSTGPAMLKRKAQYEKAISAFPDREEFYRGKIRELEEGLAAINACRRCGRPLKGEESIARGYGPECANKEGIE